MNSTTFQDIILKHISLSNSNYNILYKEIFNDEEDIQELYSGKSFKKLLTIENIEELREDIMNIIELHKEVYQPLGDIVLVEVNFEEN